MRASRKKEPEEVEYTEDLEDSEVIEEGMESTSSEDTAAEPPPDPKKNPRQKLAAILKNDRFRNTIKIFFTAVGGVGLVYKMFFAPDPNYQSSEDATQQATPTEEKQESFADKPIKRVGNGYIVAKKEDPTTDPFANKEVPVSQSQPFSNMPEPDLPPLNIPIESTPDATTQNNSGMPPIPTIPIPVANPEPSIPPMPENSGGLVGAATTNMDGRGNQQQANDPNNMANPNNLPTVSSADLTPEQKRQLSMFVMSGQGETPSSSTSANSQSGLSGSGGTTGGKDDFLIVNGAALSVRQKSEQNNNSQTVANLDTTIIQGKTLDAILETAINTQLPGPARAIIANDVYGEVGNKILIPRGSRIFGTYATATTRGQSRVTISWSRIVRPDGLSVTLSAQAADQFGRAGLQGDVDNRVGDSIANALLVTLTSLGTGLIAQQLSPNTTQTSTTNSATGNTVVTGTTPLNYAAQSAIQTATNLINNLTAGTGNLMPIISLPQGTKIKVIVNADITVPPFRKIMLQ